jgi:hypothetical protein
MSTWQQVASRLGVARCVLVDVEEMYHAAASTTQMRSVLHLLKDVPLTDTDCAEAMRLLLQCKWHGSDGEAISEAILTKSSTNTRAGTKRKEKSSMQDYAAVADYLTEDDWAALQSERISVNVKRDRIVMRLASLGCRNPDERTSKLATSILVMVTEPWSACQNMAACTKVQTMKTFKEEFKRQVRLLPAPTTWLQTLPNCVEHFRSKHADMLASVYGDTVPVKCQLDWQKLQLLNNSFKCRGMAAAESCNSLVPFSATQPQAVTGQVEQFGNMLMQGMSQMYQQQQQMMELMFRGNVKSDGIGLSFAAGNARNSSSASGSNGTESMPALPPIPGAVDNAFVSDALRATYNASAHGAFPACPGAADSASASAPHSYGTADSPSAGNGLPSGVADKASAGGAALKSSIGLMDLLDKRTAARSDEAAAAKRKKSKKAITEAVKADASEAVVLAKKPPLKRKKLKKKKRTLSALASTDAGMHVPAAHAFPVSHKKKSRQPEMAVAAVAKKAKTIAARKGGATPSEAKLKKSPGDAAALKGAAMHEVLSKPSISHSPYRLEITAATKSNPRLFVLGMALTSKHKKVEEFVSFVRKMVEKGATKADVINERLKRFA